MPTDDVRIKSEVRGLRASPRRFSASQDRRPLATTRVLSVYVARTGIGSRGPTVGSPAAAAATDGSRETPRYHARRFYVYTYDDDDDDEDERLSHGETVPGTIRPRNNGARGDARVGRDARQNRKIRP